MSLTGRKRLHTCGWKFITRDTSRIGFTSSTRGAIDRQIPLKTFYPGLPEVEETGIDDFLVVPVHNLSTSDRIYGIDDYSDLDSIIQELGD